jgi:ribosome-associated heat shock protein Hsp15
VLIDDREAKPASEIKPGIVISIKKNAAIFQYKVLQLLEKRVGAKLVDQYIRNVTTEGELEKFRLYQLAQKEYRSSGFGRPTTRDRRKLRKMKGR